MVVIPLTWVTVKLSCQTCVRMIHSFGAVIEVIDSYYQ